MSRIFACDVAVRVPCFAALCLTLCFTLCCALPVRAEHTRHVVIVGVNTSVDAQTAPLQFADDDALRYAELLSPDAASLQLLTVLDPDLQRASPTWAAAARGPTKNNLTTAIATAFRNIKNDIGQGNESDLVFVFAGHGAVSQQGEGYVLLLDARFTRSELFAQLVVPSPARFNHIIIDACSAYSLLHRGSAATQVTAFLRSADLVGHPNTGALLATRRDQATHEWSRIRGGVFSHAVQSALAGAADVDGDGAISYAEVGAFVEAASAGATDRRAQVDLLVAPPRVLLSRPLWYRQRLTPLTLSSTLAGRISISDARGDVRIDLNKSAEQSLSLWLVGPGPHVAVVAGQEHAIIDTGTTRTLGDAHTNTSSARASGDALDSECYVVPFGRGYVAGYTSRLERELQHDPHTTATRSWLPAAAAFGGATVLVLGAGVAFSITALDAAALHNGDGRITAFAARDLATRANVATGAGIALLIGAAGAAAIGVWQWPSET